MTSSKNISRRFSLIGLAAIPFAGRTAQASAHSFTPDQIVAAIKQKNNLQPGDRQSVEISGIHALAEYARVETLPATDEYALVFKIRRW